MAEQQLTLGARQWQNALLADRTLTLANIPQRALGEWTRIG